MGPQARMEACAGLDNFSKHSKNFQKLSNHVKCYFSTYSSKPAQTEAAVRSELAAALVNPASSSSSASAAPPPLPPVATPLSPSESEDEIPLSVLFGGGVHSA